MGGPYITILRVCSCIEFDLGSDVLQIQIPGLVRILELQVLKFVV